MPSFATAGPRRRMLFALPVVAIVVGSMSTPAAAWSPQKTISDTQLASGQYDNDLVTQQGGHLHFLFDTEEGPTYQEADPDGTTFGSAKLLKLTGALGDAEGIASDGNLIVALYSAHNPHPASSSLEIRRSTSGGAFFLAAQTIANYHIGYFIGNGAVAVSGTTVLVAWTDPRHGHVLLRRSTDSGKTFGSQIQLGTTTSYNWVGSSGDDGQVHLAASGSGVVAVWTASSAHNVYAKKLVMRRSTNGGASFKSTRTLDAGAQSNEGPSVVMAGTEVLISHATSTGNVSVFRSTDGGASFKNTYLSGSRHTDDDRTDVALDPGDAHSVRLVWNSHGRIYMRRSSNGGASWSATEYTHSHGPKSWTLRPNVIVSGGQTVVAWSGSAYSISNGYDENAVLARSDP